MKPVAIRVLSLAKVFIELKVAIADKTAFASKSTGNTLVNLPLTQTIIFVLKKHQVLFPWEPQVMTNVKERI